MVKNLPATQDTWVRFLGQEDPLAKGMAIHSSILAWIMDRGAWRATICGIAESEMTEQLTLLLLLLLLIKMIKDSKQDTFILESLE